MFISIQYNLLTQTQDRKTMTEDTPNFNDIVRNLLKYNSQLALSAKTGIDQSIISRLNKGQKYPHISYRTAMALINANDDLPKSQRVAV